MKIFFKAVTIIFHPLLMPVLGYFILFNSGTYLSLASFELQKFLYIFIFAGTFLLPILTIPMFYFFGKISSLDLEKRKERHLPILVTAIFYYFTFYLIKTLPLSHILITFILASFVSVMLTLIITLRWKISAHLVGIGGISALILIISLFFKINLEFYFIISLLIAGIVGSARLFLRKHNLLQVSIGFLVGFLSVSGILIFF